MLKRIVAILLIPVLLVCSAGGVIYVEHCGMSKNPSYSFSEGQKCCCSKDVHERCCHQTTIVLKKTDHSFSSSATAVSNAQFFSFLIPSCCIRLNTPEFPYRNIYSRDHAPPNVSIPLPILFRSLLI